MQRIDIKVYYSGRVQGVGFRYKVLQIAKGYEVVGYVKNLDDGRVEMLACGQEKELDEFCKNIEEVFEGFIKDIQICKNFVSEKVVKGFNIEY